MSNSLACDVFSTPRPNKYF
ncbi:hypothetical protein [Synechococcus sp. CC9311]